MVSLATFRNLALSFQESEELPHFEKLSYRIRNKIFATLDITAEKAMVKLSLIDQSVFCSIDSTVIYPVPGGWGKHGATFIELKFVSASILKDAIKHAYNNVAPASLIKIKTGTGRK
jgi:hypothetical protein